MKKHFTISFLILVLCLMISACNSVNTENNITQHKWHMEFIGDQSGKPLENEMTIKFNNETFVLKDKSEAKTWKGKYTLEKTGPSYKLDLYCNDEIYITGAYGTILYHNNEKVPSVTLQVEDKIVLFIAN